MVTMVCISEHHFMSTTRTTFFQRYCTVLKPSVSILCRLEAGHCSLTHDIQGLPKITTIPRVYILSGAITMEAQIDWRLCMLPSLGDNLTHRHIVHRQISMKYPSSNSWVVVTQAMLRKYKLPHISKIIKAHPSMAARLGFHSTVTDFH